MKNLVSKGLVFAIGTAAAVILGQLNATAQDSDAALMAALMEEGDEIFHSIGCAGCHGANGEGGGGPQLAGNQALATGSHVIGTIIGGARSMPAWGDVLDDRQIAAVGTYIRNSWGNEFGLVREASVALRR